MCYHVKFGRSVSKSVRINRKGTSKIWKRWGLAALRGGVAEPLKIRRSFMCYLAELFRYRPHGTSVIMDIRLKFEPLRPAFRGHSKSSEPTLIDRLPMTSY